ncbi:pre-peptidase C-terminal domain-containing protein [Duganella sp. Dugasp56]|uniref:pre-peptidase C-terminal domain-containing protein n=1 Tax=Duganella sp. Dugasp56 TaxID=3243046 RepID=UPI0039B044F7
MPADYRPASPFRVIAGGAAADDFGNTPATSSAAALGTSINGKLDVDGDQDVFKVQLTAGTLYNFAAQGVDDGGIVHNLKLSFKDASETGVDDAVVGPGQSYSFIPATSQTYYVSVYNPDWEHPAALDYVFKASVAADDFASTAATAGKLAIGASVKGRLEDGGGDHDWFAVSLVAGTSYWFTLKGDAERAGTMPSTVYNGGHLAVLDATGLPVSQETGPGSLSDNAPVLPFVAPATGTYYLDVSAASGTYQLQAQVATADEAGSDAAHAATMQLGAMVTGLVPVRTDVDTYKVSLVAGTTYVLQRTAADGSSWNSKLDTSILSANGQPVDLGIGSLGDKKYLYFSAETTGVYTLTVQSNGATDPATGGYALKLTAGPDAYPATAQTTGLLEVSKPVRGAMAPGGVDWVKVHLDAGKQYSFDMHSTSMELISNRLELRDAHGVLQADAPDDLFFPQDLGFAYTATSTGDYYLALYGNQPGFDYTLSEHLLTGDVTGPVLKSVSIANGATGVPVSGGIRFMFDEPVVFGQDTVMKDASGNQIQGNFGSMLQAIGNNTLLMDSGGPLQPNTTYTLTLGEIRDQAGNLYTGPKVYTFTTGAALPDDQPDDGSTTAVLTAGTTTTGYLDHMLDGDWYKFHAEAGKRYTVTSTGDAVRFIAIHDTHGNTLAPDVLLNRPGSADADYYIELYARPMLPGAYTVSVKEVVDDYSATDTGAGKLTLGTALNGALQYAGDVDRFKVTLASNVLYKITLSNGDAATAADSALALKMLDPSGKSLTPDYSGSAGGTIMYRLTTTAAGTYTLDVGDSYTPQRGYTLTATALVDEYGNTAATAAALALGKQIAGSLQIPTDKDVFSLDLAAGGSYLVSLARTQSSGATPHWTLTDSKGNLVDADPVTGTKDQSFTVGAAGKYYLTVANPSPNPSTDWDTGYGLKVSAVADDFGAAAATAGKLAIGASVAGKLEAGGGDSDWFAVALEAGATYTFSVKGTLQELYGGSATDAPLRLLDASGKQLAIVNHPTGTNSGNPSLSYTAVAKGTYYVDVGAGHSGLAGDYTLQAAVVLPDEFGNDNAHAAKLADGVVANGKLQTAIDKDVFKISLADGALVTIDFGAPTGAAVKMTVTDSSGQEIKGALHHGDTSNGIYVDSAQYQAGAGGDYYVTVSSVSAQLPLTAYSVKATIAGDDDFAGDDSTAGVLAAAKPQRGMIGVAGDADWFKVHLEAGHSYSFALQSGGTLATTNFGKAGGPGIDLYAADGSRVTATLNTADVGVTAAGIATGDYFVSVHGNAYQTGSYTVLETAKATVTPGDDYGDARETATALVLGKGVSGVLASTNDIDMFKVDLVAGTTYTFDGALNNSPSSSVQLSLLAGDGSPVYGTDGAAVSYSYTPAASGTYYMAVTDSIKFMTGASYTLKASPTLDDYSATAATVGKLVVGPASSGTVSGKLDAGGGDRDWFAISLDKDGQYTFTLDGATGHEGKNTDEQGGATLRLLDASGKVLAEVLAGGGSGALAYVPDAKGSYFLEVAGGDGHATGAYKLSVVNDADDYAGNASTKGMLAAGTPAQGVVAGPGDQDWFKVHLDGGKTYVFDMKGVKGHGGTLDTGSAGTGLALFDAAGKTQLAVSDGPSDATGETQMVYKAQATGDFFLSAYGADKGSYTLAESLGSADTKAPQLTASSLADGATGVGLGSKILLSFDDAITAGSGIRLTDEHGATLSSVVITASGNTLKIDPHQNLTPGATYTLSLPEGSVLDLSGNRYAGHASYTFTTVAPASSSTAGNGNDVFSANGTGQKIDGGAGTDTVFYDDTKVPLEIYAHDGQVTVYQTGAGTADTLTGIERLVFPTHAMAFDVDGNGGQAYRLYQAAFNRKPGEGLGFWMNALDVGAKLETVAQNFIDSPEFKTLYGDAPSNADFVTHLYSNVLHRAPLQAGYDFWLHGLDAGATRAQILINFSESAENHAALQPLIGQGFNYTPYG